MAQLGINKNLIQNTRILAKYWQKNRPIAIKTARLVIKKWSPKAGIMKMAHRRPLNIVNITSQEPEGNSDVSYSEQTARSEILTTPNDRFAFAPFQGETLNRTEP